MIPFSSPFSFLNFILLLLIVHPVLSVKPVWRTPVSEPNPNANLEVSNEHSSVAKRAQPNYYTRPEQVSIPDYRPPKHRVPPPPPPNQYPSNPQLPPHQITNGGHFRPFAWVGPQPKAGSPQTSYYQQAPNKGQFPNGLPPLPPNWQQYPVQMIWIPDGPGQSQYPYVPQGPVGPPKSQTGSYGLYGPNFQVSTLEPMKPSVNPESYTGTVAHSPAANPITTTIPYEPPNPYGPRQTLSSSGTNSYDQPSTSSYGGLEHNQDTTTNYGEATSNIYENPTTSNQERETSGGFEKSTTNTYGERETSGGFPTTSSHGRQTQTIPNPYEDYTPAVTKSHIPDSSESGSSEGSEDDSSTEDEIPNEFSTSTTRKPNSGRGKESKNSSKTNESATTPVGRVPSQGDSSTPSRSSSSQGTTRGHGKEGGGYRNPTIRPGPQEPSVGGDTTPSRPRTSLPYDADDTRTTYPSNGDSEHGGSSPGLPTHSRTPLFEMTKNPFDETLGGKTVPPVFLGSEEDDEDGPEDISKVTETPESEVISETTPTPQQEEEDMMKNFFPRPVSTQAYQPPGHQPEDFTSHINVNFKKPKGNCANPPCRGVDTEKISLYKPDRDNEGNGPTLVISNAAKEDASRAGYKPAPPPFINPYFPPQGNLHPEEEYATPYTVPPGQQPFPPFVSVTPPRELVPPHNFPGPSTTRQPEEEYHETTYDTVSPTAQTVSTRYTPPITTTPRHVESTTTEEDQPEYVPPAIVHMTASTPNGKNPPTYIPLHPETVTSQTSKSETPRAHEDTTPATITRQPEFPSKPASPPVGGSVPRLSSTAPSVTEIVTEIVTDREPTDSGETFSETTSSFLTSEGPSQSTTGSWVYTTQESTSSDRLRPSEEITPSFGTTDSSFEFPTLMTTLTPFEERPTTSSERFTPAGELSESTPLASTSTDQITPSQRGSTASTFSTDRFTPSEGSLPSSSTSSTDRFTPSSSSTDRFTSSEEQSTLRPSSPASSSTDNFTPSLSSTDSFTPSHFSTPSEDITSTSTDRFKPSEFATSPTPPATATVTATFPTIPGGSSPGILPNTNPPPRVNPYAPPEGAPRVPNRLIGKPRILCLEDGISFEVKTILPLNGEVFANDRKRIPECQKTFTEDVKPKVFLPFATCGVKNVGEQVDSRSQYHMQVVLIIDQGNGTNTLQSFMAQCVHQKVNYNKQVLPKRIEEALEELRLVPSKLEQKASMPNVQMQIVVDEGHHKLGAEVSAADIGMPLALKWSMIPESDAYGMHVRNCKVVDAVGKSEHTLIDEQGCSADLQIIDHPHYDTYHDTASAHMWAFKVPDMSSLQIKCDILICSNIKSSVTNTTSCEDIPSPPFCADVVTSPPNSILSDASSFIKHRRASVTSEVSRDLTSTQSVRTSICLSKTCRPDFAEEARVCINTQVATTSTGLSVTFLLFAVSFQIIARTKRD